MKELGIMLIILGVIVGGILFLSSEIDKNAQPTTEEFNVICLDGVEYWYRQIGYKGMMSVRMTTEGNVVACE
jgi:hypothetical protein